MSSVALGRKYAEQDQKSQRYVRHRGLAEAVVLPARSPATWAIYLRATVTYNDGEGEGQESDRKTSVHTVQFDQCCPQTILPPSSQTTTLGTPLVIADARGAVDSGEHACRVRTSGLPVEADADDNDIRVTYTIDDTAAATFDIEAATGADPDEVRSGRGH